jgi:uncharacterized protein YegL
MDKALTEIIAIVDRSGSMDSIKDDAIGGFNAFLEEQQKEKVGKCLLTYVQFDHEYDVVHDGIDIKDMKPLNYTTFVPRGSTALLDAIGRTINVVGARLAKTPEEKRPGNVVVVILTDGEENASQEFRAEQIKEMVKHQSEKYDWGFIYLAQNIDAFSTGRNMGFDASNAKMFVGNAALGGIGTRRAYAVASCAVSDRRVKSFDSAPMDWSMGEKAEYTKGLDEDSGSDSDSGDTVSTE